MWQGHRCGKDIVTAGARYGLLRGVKFSPHPRLAAGGFELGRLGGCRLLLKNNALYPWFLLVPEVEVGIEDLHELAPDRYREVMEAARIKDAVRASLEIPGLSDRPLISISACDFLKTM